MKSRSLKCVIVIAMILSVIFTLETPAVFAAALSADTVTYNEAVEALYLLDGEPPMVKQIYNTGTDTYATYEENATSWAQAYDIVSVDEDMDSPITQTELAVILYQYAKHHDVDVGEQNASDWAESYGFLTDNSLENKGTVTKSELSEIISKYEATDMPKVGVVANGLTLIYPSEGLTTINPLCDFYVIGDIAPSVTVPNYTYLFIQLRNSSGALVRDVFTNIKDNQEGMYVDYPGLSVATGTRDSFRNSMMPDLVYDPNFPETFENTWMKACYTDDHYTGLIYGGAYHDDINPVDQYGRKLEPLPEGDYTLTVMLVSRGVSIASLSTQITIGTVAEKVISRFSPTFYLDIAMSKT